MSKPSLYLENLSWKKAETALKEYPVVLLPVGARLKEHGHHLPLKNDWLIAEYLTKEVMKRCSVIALPTLQYGYYPAFVEYPGSISIDKETFKNTVKNICQSLARHGAKRFYVLNTGISTNSALEPAKEELAHENIMMDFTNLLEIYPTFRKNIEEQSEGTHADEIETSMMLYIAPEVVQMELAEKDIHIAKGPGPFTRDKNASTGHYSPTGAWGDPTLATKEKGKKVVKQLVESIVRQVDSVTG